MRGGGDDAMRVDEEAEVGLSGRSEQTFGAAPVVAGLILGGAAVFAIAGGYLLATTCWSGSWFSGCREDGAVGGVGLVVLAQLFGTIGYLVLRRESRNQWRRSAGPEERDLDTTSVALGAVRLWLSVAVSAALFGAGALALFWGLFVLGLACLGNSGCDFQSTTLAAFLMLLAQVLWVAAFVVARWALRRRPWRHDAQRE